NALMLANAVLCMVLLVTYLQANIWNLQRTSRRYGKVIGEPFYDDPREEDCIRNFPLMHDTSCLYEQFAVPLGSAEPDLIYQLAVARLSVFADVPQVNLMPEEYAPGSPIIVQSESSWLNLYVRDYLLKGIDAAQIINFAPPDGEY